jgi:hypothetical protein
VPVGVGFVLDELHVMTCAHVIEDATGVTGTTGPSSDVLITIDFPVLWMRGGESATSMGHVVAWKPSINGVPEDVAILRLNSPVPRAIEGIRACEDARPQDRFRAFGITADNPEGILVEGLYAGIIAANRGLIKATNDDDRPDHGCSGGAAWNMTRPGVLGMVVSRKGRLSGEIIPVHLLQQVFSIPPAAETPPLAVPGMDARNHSVPALPPYFLARAELHEGVIGTLLAPGQSAAIGLHGMAGIGKTVTATAIGRDPRIQSQFRDGVFWLTVGQDPDFDSLHAQLARSLGSHRVCRDAREWREHLSDLLKSKQALLILDDVWSGEHLREFDVLPLSSRLLVTTREGSLITAMGAIEVQLNVLTKAESLWLLASWSGRTFAAADPMPEQVVAECGFLPLALSVCGAMIRDGVPVADILDALGSADLAFIAHSAMHYDYPNVLKALKVSVDYMGRRDPGQAERYLELGVFPKDAAIPEQAVITLWSSTGDLSPRDGRKLLAILARKALLSLTGTSPDQVVFLHDLQHDFIHQQYEAD